VTPAATGGGVWLSFEVFGETQIRRELLRFASRTTDAMPAFEAILGQMEKDEADLFESEGQTGAHGHWAPIKPETLAAKEAQGLRPETLIATGALVSSLTGDEGPGVGSGGETLTQYGGIRIPSPQGLVFGTQVPYAVHHYTGTVHMPRRRPIDFNEGNRRKYVKTLQEYMVHGVLS
jgi:hypothetical protein